MHAFREILRSHRLRYPEMTPQDFVKLAYQSEFGPEHLHPDQSAFLTALLEEWGALSRNCCSDPPEDIGNGLCRFHLDSSWAPAEAAPLLAALCIRTASEHRGTLEGLATRLDQLEHMEIPGLAGYLVDYKRRGCPPVHHSPSFRRNYHPHYRLLAAEYACYFPALLAIQRLVAQNPRAIVSIDGRCGSGKTGLAEVIQRVFPCQVYHMDDFYLPLGARPTNWMEIPGGNMDLRRFLREVLLPARAGQTVSYRAFDCSSAHLRETVYLPPSPLTVVEGTYSQHPLLAGEYHLKLFLTCSPEVQARRLLAREGAHYRAFKELWIPMEERYFQSCAVEERCSLALDTSEFF